MLLFATEKFLKTPYWVNGIISLGPRNAADPGTRGMRTNEIALKVWLNGPAWLSENEAHWTKTIAVCTFVEVSSETSKIVTVLSNKPRELQGELFKPWTTLIHTICFNSR